MKKLALLFAALALLAALAGCKSKTENTVVWELEKADVLTFDDGETVDCWRSHTEWAESGTASLPADYVDYRLSDGTVLLIEYDPVNPLLDDELGEAVQSKILYYYNVQGKLYEVEPYLRQAYEAYQKDANSFEAWTISQTTTQTAQSEGALWFVTAVDTPLGGREMNERCYGAVFDRATGEKLDLWSLFSVPEEEVKTALLAAASGEANDAETMLSALTDDMVVFYPSYVEVYFPVGSLPGQQLSMGLGVDMEDIQPLLQEWAVPEAAG